MSARPPERDDGDDAVTLLTVQHRRLETLLAALLDATSGEDAAPDAFAERARLLRLAGDELAVHLGAEESVFYPAVRALRTEDILLESLEEHLSLKRLLADLLVLAPDDTTFAPKCKVLEEQSRHHHREEEEHLFPEVSRQLDAAARRALGRELRRHEQQLQAQGAPREAVAAQTDAATPLE